jgi:glycosyltransferase involved in cell wall biosynthesis
MIQRAAGRSAIIPVSVVVMTRDEAANIGACLASVSRFAEIFVVDSGSRDGTAAIAKSMGARVVDFRWDGKYPKKKQWCLDALPFSHDWVLYLDADERVTAALAGEIAGLMAAGPAASGYHIPGRPVFAGRPLRFGAWNSKIALLDRRRASFPPVPDLDVASMWEVEGHYQPSLAGAAGRLRHPVIHHDAKPPYAWFERHNRYSDWEAALMTDGRLESIAVREKGARRLLKRIFVRLPARPLAVFLHSYVLRLGFLDGLDGLDHAIARAFYYWQIAVKVRARRRGPVPYP